MVKSDRVWVKNQGAKGKKAVESSLGVVL